jgi:hypothetical protein
MNSVRIRMYRQGLGDCFLLTISTDSAPAHVLIDCGVLKGTENPDAVMCGVAENILEATGGHLEVLVATHEHWDHLSGFLQAEDVFEQLSVGEVWLAWTEDPGDSLAGELRKRKAHAIHALRAAARRLAASDAESARISAERIDALLDFHGDIGVDGRPTTAKALEWVKERDATIRWLRPGELLPAAGVQVYVLGPPHDRAMIKRSDPHKRDSEVYELGGGPTVELGFLAAAESLEGDGEPGRRPFGSRYGLSEDQAREQQLFGGYFAPDEAWRQIEEDWLGTAGPLALQLDSDTNNTSLVLAFELSEGGPVLLFPGDAQVGNWLSWQSVDWGDGEDGKVRAEDLLARTIVYKVGHHGSHNATLREKGLELMSSPDLIAMIPVNREMAKKMKWNMPFPALLSRLNEKTRGRIIDAELGVAGNRPDGLPATQWGRFIRRTDVQPHWVDYTVEW